MQLVYEVLLLSKILRNHLLSENMHHSMLPLIISYTRSLNFGWHLLRRSTTESKSIVKLLAISQTIHIVCCEDDFFQRENLNYLMVCFTRYTLFFQKVCFLLQICSPCVFCGTYVTKINAVLWHSARQTFPSLGLFTLARIECLFQLWIKTSDLGDAQITSNSHH